MVGLCSHPAHIWALSDFVPLYESVWKPPRRQRLCSHWAHLWAINAFVPPYEVLGTPPPPETAGTKKGSLCVIET